MKMSKKARLIFWLSFCILAIVACAPTPEESVCRFSPMGDLTVYRFPDETSEDIGNLLLTENFEVLARTSDGWLGFDPGFAQAGFIGLAHHRWVMDPLPVSPSCVDTVELVTMEEILADYEASYEEVPDS